MIFLFYLTCRTVTAVLGVHPGHGRVEVQVTEKPVKKKDKPIIRFFTKKHDIMLLKLPNPVQNEKITLPDCQNRLNM